MRQARTGGDTVQVKFRVSPGLAKGLAEIADREGVSVNLLGTKLLEAFVAVHRHKLQGEFMMDLFDQLLEQSRGKGADDGNA